MKRIAIVTGASRGIGREIAKMLAKEDIQVIANYNNSEKKAIELQEELKKENDENKDMFTAMKEALNSEVQAVRFTHRLKNHPVCLTSEGQVSIEMEKTINSQMGGKDSIKAKTILEINQSHKIAQKLKDLFNTDKEELKKYAKVLYSQARLIEGLQVEDPTEISNIICDLISK